MKHGKVDECKRRPWTLDIDFEVKVLRFGKSLNLYDESGNSSFAKTVG